MDALGPAQLPKQFVLCFDGTGNKFCGDESDSNVLKIFRMLDRGKSHQFHYYQPGIGTYVTTNTLSSHGRIHRIKSAYLKAKDSAVGSSFDQHVMGGYKFLMRYYSPGDEIYFIGFSRGAYIARFLAEMLDFIGLLEAGNEELIRFAWKTFAKWQQRRRGDSAEEKEEQRKLFRFMKAFRETFSRPITRIKFMGLFDTVNSVPRFESAWMQRSRFPYTARSSARVIRHAVGIDERRAKFRQDLISGIRPWSMKKRNGRRWHQNYLHPFRPTEKSDNIPAIVVNDDTNGQQKPQEAASSRHDPDETESVYRSAPGSRAGSIRSYHHYRSHLPSRDRKLSLAAPIFNGSAEDLRSTKSGHSGISIQVPDEVCQRAGDHDHEDEEEDESLQDIQEVWFPGGHADIGGGWKLAHGEEWALSHAPLVWMVHEAQRAGLQFDPRKLKQFECCEEYDGAVSPLREHVQWKKDIDLCQDTHIEHGNDKRMRFRPSEKEDEQDVSNSKRGFLEALHVSSTTGLIHDCLSFGNGLPPMSVLSWRIMEYLPFRRMDLQGDGSWKPIRWPLPCGEVRDIPDEAHIHVSVIRRMQADPGYRPGNLIVGGGGRGIRQAPEEYGIGEWVIKNHAGDPVREVYVRKRVAKMCKEDHA